MPATSSCTPCCTENVTTDIPGSQGGNAYTVTTANFIVPAANNNVTVAVADTDWMLVGQIVVTPGPYNFEVISVNGPVSVTLKWLDYSADAATGATVASGAGVSPSGQQSTITNPLPIANGGTGQITAPLALSALLSGAPLPVANGGTAGATKAAAIAALGVGQAPTSDANAGLTYDITNAPAQITGVNATTPATGTYLCLAVVTVDYSGTTFAANRTLTLTIRNATAGSNLVSVARNTDVHTTTSQPSIDYTLFVSSSLTASDNIQVWASLDTVESAGSSKVSACNLILIPIAI
jgi:hypothetical protein